MKRLKLPRYEYTFRELSTGACFYAYANENNSLYASIFDRYVIEHLKKHGIKVSDIEFQSDNGSEFIGSVRKKMNSLSVFEKVLKEYDIYHRRIPPRSPYLQGDVETLHRIIEDEFYDIESFDNGEVEFFGKSYSYQLCTRRINNIKREKFPKVDNFYLYLYNQKMDIGKQIDYWKQSSIEDWDVGSSLLSKGKTRHGLFFIHLALEKLLKAHVCRATNNLAPKIHSLIRLAEIADLKLTQLQRNFLSGFDHYNIAGRYPDMLGLPPKHKEAERELKNAKEVYQWLIKQL